MAGEKTEKATPKKKEDARKKGQVAKSQDLTGSVVMLSGLLVLGATGAAIADRMGSLMRESLAMGAASEVVSRHTIGAVMLDALKDTLLAVAPIAGACMVAAIIVSVVQVGPKPTPGALKPDPKRLNPVSGFKNIMGPNALVTGAQSIAKVAVVAVVVLIAVLPQLTEMASMVGMSPAFLAERLAADIHGIAMRAAFAYILLGVIDVFWQRFRHEKSLRMDHQEIKEEQKGHALPAEVRMAMRRRQMSNARARMMEAIPEADVVVTNPTHFSVALKYDGGAGAPQVVAKGQDLLALKIREIAKEHGVPVIPEPPLARSLYATVEVGQEIPEELFAAVAQILAYVYRVAGRRSLAAA